MNEKHREHNKKEKETHPFSERLGTFLDIPGDLLCGGCYLELRGRGELRVQGCRNILVYSARRIVLQLRRGVLCIRGARLVCTSYHAGTVEIGGRIDGMDFEESDRGAETEADV